MASWAIFSTRAVMWAAPVVCGTKIARALPSWVKARWGVIDAFATQDGSTLPIEVVAWLKLWLNRRPAKETAFVSLTGSSLGPSLNTPTHQFLRYLAERHQLAFFSSTFTVPKNTAPELTITTFQQTIRYNPCPEGWGLND